MIKCFFLMLLFPLMIHGHNLRSFCRICKDYDPDILNQFWFGWFEHSCHEVKNSKSITCFYYNYQLDIHSVTFWKQWESCDCIKDDANYLSFLHDDQKQIIEFYRDEL